MSKKLIFFIQLLVLVITLNGCQVFMLTRKNKYLDPTPVQREAYVQSHPEISADFKKYILKGDIKQGMTKDQVRAVWGLPDEIKKLNHKEYDELWIYYPHWNWVHEVYFKNNIFMRYE